MANPAGIAGQVGWKSEGSWGTPATVDTFYPGLRSESVKNDGGARIPSQGIRAGRTVDAQHARGVPIIGGPLQMELGNAAIAAMLKHCFGAVSTAGAGPYVHTYTPGDLTGKSFTLQIGRPDASGTVDPRTFAGCKVADWEIAARAGELAMFNVTVSAKSETGGTALATASYPSGWAPFSYASGALTLNAVSQNVDSFSIKGANNLRTNRSVISATKAITEQLPNGLRNLTIDLEADFESLTIYNDFLNDTGVTLVITLSNGTDSLVITAKGFLTGESPVIAGQGILKMPVHFVIESATSDADALTAVLTSSLEASAA